MDQVTAFMQAIGLPPALAGTGLLLALLLRYARGMFHAINSEWTYVLALVFGAVGALLTNTGPDWRPVVLHSLGLACLVLVAQKVLEKAAATIPWLPQDNEWAVSPVKSTQNDKENR